MKVGLCTFLFMTISGTAWAQQGPATLNLGGLGCTTSLGADTFTVQTWNFAVGSNGPVANPGKPYFTDLTVVKSPGACGASLFKAVYNKTVFPTLTVSQYDTGGTLRMLVQLWNATACSDQMSGNSEQINFNYTKIQFTTYFPSAMTRYYDLAAMGYSIPC